MKIPPRTAVVIMIGASPRSPSGSANGPLTTMPRYVRLSVTLRMRINACEGALGISSLGNRIVMVLSSLDGRSNIVRPIAVLYSGGSLYAPPASALSARSCSNTSSGSGRCILVPELWLSIMRSASFLSRLALSKVAEWLAGLGIGLLDHALKCTCAKGGAADHIRQVDQHWKAAMFLQHAIGHYNQGRQVRAIAMRVKHAHRRMGRCPVHADHDLRPQFLHELPHTRLQPCLHGQVPARDIAHRLQRRVDQREFKRVERIAQRKPDTISGRAYHKHPAFMLHQQSAPHLHTVFQQRHLFVDVQPSSGQQFIRHRMSVAHTPYRLRFMQQDSAFRVNHDAALGEIAEPGARALCRGGAVALPALFEQSDGFINRINAAHTQVAAIQAMQPGTRVPLVRDKRNAYLRQRNRQRIVNRTRPIARLDAAIEE